MESEWDVVQVNMRMKCIEIFCPIRSTRGWNALYPRVFKVLDFEHRAIYGQPLSSEWSSNRKEPDRYGAQCLRACDAGFFALEYVRLLVKDVHPWQSAFSNNAFTISNIRLQPVIVVGTRFNSSLAELHLGKSEEPKREPLVGSYFLQIFGDGIAYPVKVLEYDSESARIKVQWHSEVIAPGTGPGPTEPTFYVHKDTWWEIRCTRPLLDPAKVARLVRGPSFKAVWENISLHIDPLVRDVFIKTRCDAINGVVDVDLLPDKDFDFSIYAEMHDKEYALISYQNGWLNDKCIVSWIKYLVSNMKIAESCMVSDSLIWRRISASEYDKLPNGYKGENIFQLERLIIPVHASEHWSLVSINFKTKTVSYYDSLGGCVDENKPSARAISAHKHIMAFLRNRWESIEGIDSPFSEQGWPEEIRHPVGVPQQSDYCQCGVFVCAFIERLLSGEEPTKSSGFSFTLSDSLTYRVRMNDNLRAYFSKKSHPAVDGPLPKDINATPETTGSNPPEPEQSTGRLEMPTAVSTATVDGSVNGLTHDQSLPQTSQSSVHTETSDKLPAGPQTSISVHSALSSGLKPTSNSHKSGPKRPPSPVAATSSGVEMESTDVKTPSPKRRKIEDVTLPQSSASVTSPSTSKRTVRFTPKGMNSRKNGQWNLDNK
ncbi:SUMO1 sentrin specific peptidase 1 [Tulasnella sp. 418]|nr:SUMO1 sentrin specific peptidase 1 [Tulasnella sp. 418]